MPTDRVILLFETVLNPAGIDAANRKMLDLTATTALVGVALGALIYVGKSAIDNAKAQEEANNQLNQAYEASGQALMERPGQIDAFIEANKRFIDNQYAAKDSIAAFIRSGMDTDTALKLMGEALDLAAIKHISTADAAHALLLASEGNTKALKDLGFTTADLKTILAAAGSTQADVTKLSKEAEVADAKLAKAKEAVKLEEDALHGKRTVTAHDLDVLHQKEADAQKAADEDAAAHARLKAAQDSQQDSNSRGQAVADALKGKLQDGRNATDSLAQSTNALNKDWQDITSGVGPPLLGLFAGIAGAADAVVQKLIEIGNNKDWNSFLYSALGDIQNLLVSIIRGFQWLLGQSPSGQSIEQQVKNSMVLTNVRQAGRQRASGGPVMAGEAYTVGEQGPETLVMGGSSGTIIPNGAGGGGNHVHIHIPPGSYLDGPSIDRLANLILRAGRHRPGI